MIDPKKELEILVTAHQVLGQRHDDLFLENHRLRKLLVAICSRFPQRKIMLPYINKAREILGPEAP